MKWYQFRTIVPVYVTIYLSVYALYFFGPPQSETFFLIGGGIVMAISLSYNISRAEHFERVIFQHLNILYQTNLDQRNPVHRAKTRTITPQYMRNDPTLQQAYQKYMQHVKIHFFHIISFGILIMVAMTVSS